MKDSTTTLTRLRTQLDALPILLEGVPREQYDKRVEDRWSVTENVAHLARYHEISIERIRLILTEREPSVLAYRAEDDSEWRAWQARSFEEVMQRMHASRATLIGVAERLMADEWARTARHSRFGVLSLHAWLEFFLVHESHHLYVITRRARGLA